jgi:hypothetical protein
VRIDRAGEYEVAVIAQFPKAGNGFTIRVGDEMLTAQTPTVEGGNFTEEVVGRIRLVKNDSVAVVVRPTGVTDDDLMKFRALILRPVASP